MRIIHLKAENVKKLKAVEITPKDNTVVISGRNGQGKSSVLDSIVYALGGKDAQKLTVKPIREGEKEASVEIDLGDYIVRRTWTSNEKSYLAVEGKKGEKFPSPQALLDSLVGELSFDPLEFARMDAKKQRDTLLGIVKLNIDLNEWAEEYARVYEERRVLGVQGKAVKGKFDTMPTVPEGTPDEEVSVAAVVEEMKRAEEHNRKYNAAHDDVAKKEAEVRRLEAALESAKKERSDALEVYEKIGGAVVTTHFEEKIASAEETNRMVRLKIDRAATQAEVESQRKEYLHLSGVLEEMESEKREALTSAHFPIPHLSIDDNGVTFNGMPFTQCSSAEQLRVSMAIAMAKNPKLRVIRILDGSLLDDDNLDVIREMAKANDFQVWVEKVDGSGKVGICIEEGRVISKAA